MLLLFEPLFLLRPGDSRANAWRLLPAEVLELFAQASERQGTVPVLASLLARHGPHAGREVYEAYGALGDVLMLSARAPGAEGLHPTLSQELVVVLWDLGWIGRSRIDVRHGCLPV